MASVKNEIGATYNRLRVLSQAPSQAGKAAWHCVCVCGNERVATGDELRTRKVQSCGCLQAEGRAPKHGHGSYKRGVSPTYKSWQCMHERCRRLENTSYHNYGAKGITVCDRWTEFENFLADMGERPPGTSIDRIDNSLGYGPGNCRWADRQTQNANRSQIIAISRNGKTLPLAAWCRELKVPYSRIYHRVVVQSMSFEEAITKP